MHFTTHMITIIIVLIWDHILYKIELNLLHTQVIVLHMHPQAWSTQIEYDTPIHVFN